MFILSTLCQITNVILANSLTYNAVSCQHHRPRMTDEKQTGRLLAFDRQSVELREQVGGKIAHEG